MVKVINSHIIGQLIEVLMGIESYISRGNWGDGCILRNRKTGKTYNCGYQ